MKFIKERGWLLTADEYNRLLRQDNGEYLLPINMPDFNENMDTAIKSDIANGLSRPKICEKNGLSLQQLDYYLEKTYRTKKITSIRNFIKESK